MRDDRLAPVRRGPPLERSRSRAVPRGACMAHGDGRMPVRAGGAPRAALPPGGESASGQNQLGQVARSSGLNLVGALMSALSTFGITILVTKAFPKQTAGAFFAASSAYFIVKTLATLGANNGLVYFVARLRALGEDRRLRAIMRSAVLSVSVGSLLAMVALFVL